MRYLLLVFILPLAACLQPKALPVMGQVGEFRLTAQTGEPFDSRSLAGRVWVADFIFTTCQGPCPRMSSQMRQVQNLTAELPEVKLVSFTVDPERDTPPVLAEYARHFQYDPARWYFLTGPAAELNRLGLESFKLNKVDGSLTHSTRFVLVDGGGRIRGYYLNSDDDFLRRLVHDIRQLARETT